MTEGISKKRLLEIDPWDYENQQDLLNAILDKCAELDPWIPVDENTPKDRKLLLYWPMFVNLEKTILWKIYNPEDWTMYKPTHYKLLPD